MSDGAARFDGDALLGQAETIVALCKRKTQQAEVYLERGAELDVGIENDAIAAMGTGLSSGGGLRVISDGRLGFAYFTRLDDAPRALDQAIAQARHATAKGFSFPAGARTTHLPGRWDETVAQLSVPDCIASARLLLQGAQESLPDASVSGGGCSLSASVVAIANTEGVSSWDRTTSCGAGASLVLEEGERSISAGESGTSHSATLDAHAIGVAAAAIVASLRKPMKVEAGGSFDVILKPEGTAELLVDLSIEAATGDEARRGKTAWSDKLGLEVAAKGFSLMDDSWHPHAIGGVPFDDEGVPTKPLPIIQDGVLQNFIYDSWDAHEHGAKSTASAGRGDFKSRPSTTTHHLVMTGRAWPLSKLIAGVDDGFLIESMLGAHTANVTTGDFSVTSPNVWRIKAGEVVGASSGIALAGRLGNWLMKVDGVSEEAKAMSGARLPHTLVRGVDVSV